jgi:hypothetical protein
VKPVYTCPVSVPGCCSNDDAFDITAVVQDYSFKLSIKFDLRKGGKMDGRELDLAPYDDIKRNYRFGAIEFFAKDGSEFQVERSILEPLQ